MTFTITLLRFFKNSLLFQRRPTFRFSHALIITNYHSEIHPTNITQVELCKSGFIYKFVFTLFSATIIVFLGALHSQKPNTHKSGWKTAKIKTLTYKLPVVGVYFSNRKLHSLLNKFYSVICFTLLFLLRV